LSRSRNESIDARLREATILTVAEDGFAGLNVRAICVRASASEAQFRERWPDEWAVLLAAFDERTRLPTLPDTGNLNDDLVAYILGLVQIGGGATFARFMFCLLAELKSNAELRRRVGPDYFDRRARNLTLIERAIARGELPAEVDGNALLDEMLRLIMSWAGASPPPQESEVRRAVQEAIAGARSVGEELPATVPTQDRPAGGYRLYLFDPPPKGRGRRRARAEPLASLTDNEAIAQADARRSGRYAELWKDDHVLRIFEPK
jgi:AcrR family transcriptional regulator